MNPSQSRGKSPRPRLTRTSVPLSAFLDVLYALPSLGLGPGYTQGLAANRMTEL